MTAPRKTLSIPKVISKQYEQNFIQTAVCELRFPTLLELETKPPSTLNKKLRRNYPGYTRERSVGVDLPDKISGETRYLFRSKEGHWTVSLRSYAIALENTMYVNFEEFCGHLQEVLMACKDIIDTDFFTRVGLRYINGVPIEDNELQGWIRPDLVKPIEEGLFGDIYLASHEVRGITDVGQYTFRHGYQPIVDQRNVYGLDFDWSVDNVRFDQAVPIVETLHDWNFSMFYWCLGDKGKRALGKGTAKTQSTKASRKKRKR